jgi:tRNA (mo5U34)-methyltransferase
MTITKEKRVNVGKFQFSVGMSLADAEAMRKSLLYRRVLRPILSLTGRGSRNGHRPSQRNWHLQAQVGKKQAAVSPEAQKILDKVNSIDWYHVIDLPHGLVTPGFVDHRHRLDRYGLPEDMTGLRALDVATYDGFWAREMERRGAEVVAIDIESMAEVDLPRNWKDRLEQSGFDKPTGAGFKLVSELLGSKVKRKICSVYELGPEKFGMFDVAFCSDLLLHLRDPLMAIENIWRVVTGYAIFADVYEPELEAVDAPVTEFAMADTTAMWWRPNSRCLTRMMQVARFSRVEEVSRFKLDTDLERDLYKVVLKAYR